MSRLGYLPHHLRSIRFFAFHSFFRLPIVSFVSITCFPLHLFGSAFLSCVFNSGPTCLGPLVSSAGFHCFHSSVSFHSILSFRIPFPFHCISILISVFFFLFDFEMVRPHNKKSGFQAPQWVDAAPSSSGDEEYIVYGV